VLAIDAFHKHGARLLPAGKIPAPWSLQFRVRANGPKLEFVPSCSGQRPEIPQPSPTGWVIDPEKIRAPQRGAIGIKHRMNQDAG
jgi:hypothetical protein